MYHFVPFVEKHPDQHKCMINILIIGTRPITRTFPLSFILRKTICKQRNSHRYTSYRSLVTRLGNEISAARLYDDAGASVPRRYRYR